jgi:hypothetical protein
MWNFDATGTVINSVIGQKKPFLYSIVVHDHKKRIILNLADFVTTEHTTTSIATYLMQIKDIYARFNAIGAPIFCSDFSWPNITASLRVFNLCSIGQYLEWCFDFLVEKTGSSMIRRMPTRVILCCSHFIKLVIKHGKKIDCDERTKRTFYYCFSLMQNAVSMDEFNLVLINTFILFRRPVQDSETAYAYNFLKAQLESRSIEKRLDFYKISSEIKDDKDYPNKFFDPLNYQNETSDSIKSISKFAPYFEGLLKKVQSKNCDGQANRFYSPGLYAIVDQWLHLMPLWTSLITKDIYDSNHQFTRQSRHSNNYVENWFNQIKNKYLRGKTVMPSILGSELYANIESKYFEHYEHEIPPESNAKIRLQEF